MSNPDYPWFRFYVREWLTDVRVRAMSLAARGAYIDLLCYQWENGTIPEDVAQIARLLGVTAGELEPIWPELADRFRRARRGGGLQNPRLENERCASRRRKDNAREAGKASVERRRERGNEEEGEEGDAPNPVQTPSKSGSHNYRTTTRLAESRSNGSPTIQDADADEYEDEEKIADARPSAPAPPISNPGPPSCRKTASTESNRKPGAGKSRTRWGEFVGRWNELAAAEDLPKIGGALSDGRKRKARAVMAAMRRRGLDWFEVLAGAVRDRRGTWARGMRFPTLDQAFREEIVDRLVEGFYERDRQSSSSQPEHLNRQTDFKNTEKESWTIVRPEDRR